MRSREDYPEARMIHYVVHERPYGQGRARATVRGRHASVYTPSKTREKQKTIGKLLRAMHVGQPLNVPLKVTFVFYMPILKSWSKKKTRRMIGAPHVKKPDLSNLVKLVEDAGNGIVWEDDNLIYHYGDSRKVYDPNPRIELFIETADFEVGEQIHDPDNLHGLREEPAHTSPAQQ